MLIKDLPIDLRELAEKRAMVYPIEGIDPRGDLASDIDWNKTPEGMTFWSYVNGANFDTARKLLKKKPQTETYQDLESGNDVDFNARVIKIGSRIKIKGLNRPEGTAIQMYHSDEYPEGPAQERVSFMWWSDREEELKSINLQLNSVELI